MNKPITNQQLHILKLTARFSVGFVWIYEGLVPKILFPTATQICMVQNSGWWWGSPEATLHVLGIAMVIAGIVIISGWLERLAQVVATLSVLVLMFLVARNHPPALYDPFGGLAKDACLFTCSALVWMLSKNELQTT